MPKPTRCNGWASPHNCLRWFLRRRNNSMGLPQPSMPTSQKPARLISLDAYRGFIMLVMASGGLAHLSGPLKGHPFWEFLSGQLDHVEWEGCCFWDLIQPSFMFMVGVAMPFSYASRRAKGESNARILTHVVYRSIILILLGIFLSSNGRSQTDFTFVNVLTQIGLGYTFVFLFLGRRWWLQFLGVAAILTGYWLFFLLH